MDLHIQGLFANSNNYISLHCIHQGPKYLFHPIQQDSNNLHCIEGRNALPSRKCQNIKLALESMNILGLIEVPYRNSLVILLHQDVRWPSFPHAINRSNFRFLRFDLDPNYNLYEGKFHWHPIYRFVIHSYRKGLYLRRSC